MRVKLYLFRPAKLLAVMILFVFVLAVGTAGVPALAQQEDTGETSSEAPEPPEVDAAAWALMDVKTGRYLAGSNPDEQLPTASMTKVMTALVALENADDLDREVTVSLNAASYAKPPYSNVGLYPGDQVSIRELIQATLIPSGIDAVYALAEAQTAGSVDRFVNMMNEKADAMGLENTNFENPTGIDAPEHYSSARDLAKMAQAGLQNPFFAETVDTQQTTITTQDREIRLLTTNELLALYPPATGVKTGTTQEAGPSLISSAKEGNESYIAVVLNAPDRFSASAALLDYAFDRYEQRPLVEKGKSYEDMQLPYRRDETVKLAATEEVTGLAGESAKVERRVNTPEPPDQASKGDEMGTVEVLVDGRSVGRSPLVAQSGYDEASLWNRVTYTVGGLFQ